MTDTSIESVLKEKRLFQPPEALAEQATIGNMESYRKLAAEAEAQPEQFWRRLANQELHWFSPFQEVLNWSNPPFARWFEGAPPTFPTTASIAIFSGPRLISGH